MKTNRLSTETRALETIVYARQDLLSSDMSETEMVMVNMDNGAYYGLEDVGKLIWDALAEPRAVSELIDLVLRRYPDAERAAVEKDVPVFLDELLEDELIQIQDDR